MRFTNIFISLIFIVQTITSYSQFSDDFSDLEFFINPTWFGDTGVFIISTDNMLQLFAPAETNTKYLATSSKAINNATWEFYVQLDFNPSSSNYTDVYLVSDHELLTSSLSGYFVRIGNTHDEISLYRQDDEYITKIIDGVDGELDTPGVHTRVKVTRDINGNWKLYVDTLGGSAYKLEGEIFDDTFIKSKYFGIKCVFSSTRADKFYFDDFIVSGKPFLDTIPPTIINLDVLSSNILKITFSESMNFETITNNTNFQVDNFLGNPDSIISDTSLNNTYLLIFENEFKSGISYTINIQNITDESDNLIEISQFQFYYYKAKPFDIVINELMIDPSPSIALPEYEYIELYNNSSYNIDLTGWKFLINEKYYNLPDSNLNTKEYLLITAKEAESYFLNFGKVLGLEDFAALNNEEANIELIDNTADVIFFINYTDEWYHDVFKSEGGWSIEMIDPDNPCEGINNWKATKSYLGGTPCSLNSVFESNPDNENPIIQRAGIIGDSIIRLYFNEPITFTGNNINNIFQVDNKIDNPIKVNINPPGYSTLDLIFPVSFKPGIIYTIDLIKDSICDCVLNPLNVSQPVKFALPDSIEFNYIIINEVLFNPIYDGVDFVELYNPTENTFDINDLCLVSIDEYTGEYSTGYDIINESYLMLPDEYIVISENGEKVKDQYNIINHNNFIDVKDLPTFPNNEGRVIIVDKWENVIDDFLYNEEMHFPLLSSFEGVSLERINPWKPTNDLNNWHSAAETVGFATPCYQNSQYKEHDSDEQIKISPVVFSPDNDGYDDFLTIEFVIEEPGYVCTIIIYDSRGRKIKNLVNHKLIEISGSFIWDGTDNNSQLVQIGHYVILIELYDAKGKSKRIRKTCVVAKKLK
ncbi:MAG: lamin tail domain-containing protein [Bacteroidales bacterium]|nr:lamin tail domain-containing protein [Bacteroidales bacterium]